MTQSGKILTPRSDTYWEPSSGVDGRCVGVCVLVGQGWWRCLLTWEYHPRACEQYGLALQLDEPLNSYVPNEERSRGQFCRLIVDYWR